MNRQSPRQAGQGRTRACVPPIRALSVSPQTARKFGLGMGRKRTKNGHLSIWGRALGRAIRPFYPKRTHPDRMGSRAGVGLTTIYSSMLVSSVFAYIIYFFVIYAFRWAFPKKEGKAPEKQDKDPEKQDKEPNVHKREEEHEVLMLLATFAVTITYVAGLGPPGGFWSNSQDGHRASDPIMQDYNSSLYPAFFVCNSTAFVASLLIIVLLLDKKLSKNFSVRSVALYGFIAVALIGLVGSYAGGSCREADNTIYVVFLAGAVLAYIFLQLAITKAMKKKGRWCHTQLTTIRDSTWLKKIKGLFTPTPANSSTSSNTGADKVLEKNRSLVMLLATLVVSITYQAGLDPPGGLWPDEEDGIRAVNQYSSQLILLGTRCSSIATQPPSWHP